MSEWKEYNLGDLGEITSSKRIFYSDYVSDGVPFYRSKEIIEKSFGAKISTELFITKERFIEIKNKYGAPKNGDILFSAVGERAGIPYCVKNDGDFYFKDGNLIWIRNIRDNVSPNFLVHYFKSNIGQQSLESTMIGSAQKALTIIGLKGLALMLPTFAEQTAIAEVLSSLDDKIDLLHRQNKTMEQLAETLFRQWFVEEAEEGWEVGSVNNLFRLQRGFDLPIQNRIEGKYPIVTSSGIGGTHNEFKVKGPGVTTGRSGLLGKVFYIDEDFWPLNTSLFVVEYKIASPLFTYFFLKTLDIASLNGGSAVPTLNRNDVHSLETYLPPKARIAEFEKITGDFFKKIKTNNNQIQTLTELRDELLPKLMSGEVRVKN